MAPATHGDMITNDYYLNVNTSFDNGCGDGGHSISLPLTVIPATHQGSYGFTEPPGFAPYQLAYLKFDLLTHLY